MKKYKKRYKLLVLILLVLATLMAVASVNAAANSTSTDYDVVVNLVNSTPSNQTTLRYDITVNNSNPNIRVKVIDINGTPLKNNSISNFYGGLPSTKTDENGIFIFNTTYTDSMDSFLFGINRYGTSNFYINVYYNITKTITVDKNMINWGENEYITISLLLNNNPMNNKSISYYIYDLSTLKYSGNIKTDENGRAKIFLNDIVPLYSYAYEFYFSCYDTGIRVSNSTNLWVKPAQAKVEMTLTQLKGYTTKIDIKLSDKNGNPLKNYYVNADLLKLNNGKIIYATMNVISNNIYVKEPIYNLINFNIKTNENGVLSVVVPFWVYKGTLALTGSVLNGFTYDINYFMSIDKKIPLSIKITNTNFNKKYYFIEYATYSNGVKINKNLKAIIDGKTYTGENGIFFIPINSFKTYKARLYYDGDSDYAKAELNTSYKLTGNEIYKVSSTAGKIIKKFKRFGHTYGKYKVYTVKERLNGEISKSFSGYQNTLLSSKKYRLFKTVNEKIVLYGLPSLFLKNKLKIKAYYDGDNNIKLDYYFYNNKGKLSKLGGYIKIHKYSGYYSWTNNYKIMRFTSDLNRRLATKYAKIVGW